MPAIDLITSTVEYRDVPGFIGYRAGDDGSIWSRRCKPGPRFRDGLRDTWKPLKGSIQKASTNAYYRLYCFRRDGDKAFFIRGHQVIALTFHGPCPSGQEVRHLDGNGLNNRLGNLRYGTRVENVADRDLHGTMPRGENHPDAKISDADVDEIRRRAAMGECPKSLADEFGISEWHTKSIVQWKDRRLPAHKRCPIKS